MKKALLSVLVVVLLAGLAGCAQAVSGEVLQSEKERETSPDVSKTDTDILVEGNSTFAFELYQALKGEEGNLFYSPYSISLALAMTYAGAAGGTEQQMADTLNYILEQNRLHPAFNSLDIELGKRGEGAKGKDDEAEVKRVPAKPVRPVRDEVIQLRLSLAEESAPEVGEDIHEEDGAEDDEGLPSPSEGGRFGLIPETDNDVRREHEYHLQGGQVDAAPRHGSKMPALLFFF